MEIENIQVEQTVDLEWVYLIFEARSLGLTIEDIKSFIKESTGLNQIKKE